MAFLAALAVLAAAVPCAASQAVTTARGAEHDCCPGEAVSPLNHTAYESSPPASPRCCVEPAATTSRGTMQVTASFALTAPDAPVPGLVAPTSRIVDVPRGGAPPTSTPRYILLSVFLI